MRRRLLPLPLAILLAGCLLVVAAGPALAHVTVDPGQAAQGSFQELAFRVPNERDDAATTKVEIAFPTDHPIAFVSVEPLPGWTAKVDRAKLAKPVSVHGGEVTEAVSRITWSGGSIKAGEYEDFEVSAGPLPEGATKLEFKALQTYSSGEVVRWIQSTPEGGEEPEHPAPTLTLTAATGEEPGAGQAPAPAVPAAASDQDVDAAATRGTVGIVLGAIGLLLGAAALVLALRKPSRPSP